MNTEITKNLMAVVVRGGIEVWIDEDKVDSLKSLIERGGIIGIGKNLINSKDIVGIFEAEVIQERDNKKGGYKCLRFEDTYHTRGEKCEHYNSLGYKI